MKKKAILTFLSMALLALFATGCNQKENNAKSTDSYKEIIQLGKKAILKEKFDQAVGLFSASDELKSSKQSEAYISQATALSTAKKYLNKQNFTKAKQSLDKLTGSKYLLDETESIQKKLSAKIVRTEKTTKVLTNQLTTINDLFAKGENESALTSINKFLQDSNLKKSVNSNIYTDALKLKINIMDKLAGNSINPDAAESSSTSSSSSASTSSVETNDHDDADAINSGSVTAADISKARSQLTSQGVDSSAWSDSDIAKAVVNARNDNRTTVKESDMENYIGD